MTNSFSGPYEPKKNSAFSDFFRNASPEEKKHLMEDVAREATEEQRKVVEKVVLVCHDGLHFFKEGSILCVCTRLDRGTPSEEWEDEFEGSDIGRFCKTNLSAHENKMLKSFIRTELAVEYQRGLLMGLTKALNKIPLTDDYRDIRHEIKQVYLDLNSHE